MAKVKVTVVERLSMHEIFGDKLPAKVNQSMVNTRCPLFEEGQEFIMDWTGCPQNFCGSAYADIHRNIMHILWGGDYPWMEEKGVGIACCTDGLRPVIFRLERIDD